MSFFLAADCKDFMVWIHLLFGIVGSVTPSVESWVETIWKYSQLSQWLYSYKEQYSKNTSPNWLSFSFAFHCKIQSKKYHKFTRSRECSVCWFNKLRKLARIFCIFVGKLFAVSNSMSCDSSPVELVTMVMPALYTQLRVHYQYFSFIQLLAIELMKNVC